MTSIKTIIVGVKAVFRPGKQIRPPLIPPKLLSRALGSLAWQQFERGKIAQAQCFHELSRLFDISNSDLAGTLKHLNSLLEPDHSTLNSLCRIKARLGVRLVLVANASPLTWSAMKQFHSVLTLFDACFISCELGVRKPELQFYEKVLQQLDTSARNVLYLDTSPECIAAARTFGMEAAWLKIKKDIDLCIERLLGDPIEKGCSYLKRHAKQLHSECRGPLGNLIIKENFAQLLILEATDDPSLVTYQSFSGLWNFFQEPQTITTAIFPNDMDTTSVAMTLLSRYGPQKLAKTAMQFSFANQSIDGLPLIYEDKQRPRIDMVACVHIFTMFYINGRAQDVQSNWNYICRVLLHRGYDQGSLYYGPPEYFLYALSRLVTWSKLKPDFDLRLPACISSQGFQSFEALFKLRCYEQIGVTSTNALSLALKMLACYTAGIDRSHLRADLARLRSCQQADGSWPWCELYRVPSAKAGMGSPGLTTAFAVKALRTVGSTPDRNNHNVA